MRVIITGATGAIGMSLIAKMLTNGDEVTVLVNPGSSRNERLSKFSSLFIKEASLDEYDNLELSGEYDAFVHMAWNGGKDRNNVTLNFASAEASVAAVRLAARLNCKVFLSTGSQAEYGLVSSKISDNTECWPDTAFGVSKLSSMYLTRNECKNLNIRSIWLRIFSVYGPYDGEQTMIMQSIRNAKMRKAPKFTSGTQLWDFLHSDDISEAICKLLSEKKCTGVYTVANGKKRHLYDYLEELTKELGFKADECIGQIKVQNSASRSLWVDCSKLIEHTGWAPRIDFIEGIRDVISYCDAENG